MATHRRARPGQRRTDGPPPARQGPLPPADPGLVSHPRGRDRAACGDFIERLLGDRPLDRLRSAQGVLRLGQRYSPTRLDAACARALAVGEYRYHTVKTILATLSRASPAQPHARRGRHPGDPGPPRPPLDHLFPDPGAKRSD